MSRPSRVRELKRTRLREEFCRSLVSKNGIAINSGGMYVYADI